MNKNRSIIILALHHPISFFLLCRQTIGICMWQNSSLLMYYETNTIAIPYSQFLVFGGNT